MRNFLNKLSKEFFILAGFVSVYISYLIYFTFSKHINFFSGRYDLGNMDQTVWNTLHGQIFLFTYPDVNENLLRLAAHSDFMLIFLAPFYLIWDDARMLLLIQTVVIALGAFFVYAIGKIILSQKFTPLLIAISYLLNPYVNYQNMFDFHSISLATTFILAAFYFLLKNNYKRFSVFSILTLLCKEHTFLVMSLFGLYIFFFKRKWWGIIVAIISFVIFYLLITMFMPEAKGASHFALAYYKDFGNSLPQMMLTFFTNPIKVFSTMLQHDIFSYLKFLFMPVGYLSIFSPFSLIFALPEFLINTLSSNQYLRYYYFHYAAVTIPFIYISTFYGIKRILPFLKKIKLTWLLSCYIIFFSLFSAWYFGPLPGAKKPANYVFKAPKERDTILRYMRNLPQNISIAATNNIGAHLAHRENLYTTSTSGIEKSDMVLILGDKKLTQKMLQNPNFYVAYSIKNFTAFQKIKKL